MAKRVIFPSNNPFGGGESTIDRKAKKRAAARTVSRRVVRVAEGWKVEETNGTIKRRSPDTWHTRDAAELAMEDGYQMPVAPPAAFRPTMRVYEIIEYRQPHQQCFLCKLKDEYRSGQYGLRVRFAGGDRRASFTICSADHHDLAVGDHINDRFEKMEF